MNLNDSTLGRWFSPDPLGGDITNPQSLNRYAYALNNPETLTDPLGLFAYCPNGETDNQCNSAPDNGNVFDLADVINVFSFAPEEGAAPPRIVQNPPVSPMRLITWPQLTKNPNPCSSILGKGGVVPLETALERRAGHQSFVPIIPSIT